MCAAAVIYNELNDGKIPDCTRGQPAGGREEGGFIRGVIEREKEKYCIFWHLYSYAHGRPH
jgi:hypothetical protein